MPIFGTSILSFIPGWTPDAGQYAIKKTAEYGFDMLEIILPASLDFDSKLTKKQLDAAGISARCTLNLPADCHIPFYPENATEIIKKALDKVAEMDGDFLGGVLHSAIGTFTGKPCSNDEKLILQQVFSEVSTYASKQNITIAIEPINRYESYVFTSTDEVLDLINCIPAKNLGLHLDTFHMNIEEKNFYNPIIRAGKNLKHLHITESDRGMTGEGNVHWDNLFKALAEINYQEPLVLENFSSEIKELIGPTSLWRSSKYNSEDLAKGSLKFIKAMVNKHYNNSHK
ncbi:D-psicose/D-tagatose/L-ribulose 3-epimerase [Flavobacterium glycines]|uniref:D-psicose/D-tagatose/L-ribulose 3-epimerase n=1 Tax=Flavobacterium glycines TaxID=551990 RepID=A0A1B9DSR1_9FLAO|nr:sugar phosphate isomerase/epimerase family protein [Flavobacterium glycines]OCB72716.1 xylose isomerase [Flavobacterium glycines]GEL11806.1 tagatose 3-epimerase [Flavobacterium glycines]SDJ81091.1 D-psicose/D-tagatose/L-ribulose 3-epimerase [Flavobacterium glycines]